MDTSTLGAVGLIVAVLVAGLVLRRGSGSDAATSPRPEGSGEAPEVEGDDALDQVDDDAIDELLDEVSEQSGELGHDEDHVVAVTSDGDALVADRHAVRLVPPETEIDEVWHQQEAGVRARNRRGDAAMAASWAGGDLTGVRVVRGEASEAPWRLDTLGRDGEYGMLLFETESGARAARDLFEKKRIVRPGRGDDGEPLPPSREQFEDARRIYLETMADLEAGGADDEP